MANEKKLFLLDAMALIYRAYFALQRSPRITSKGRNTNAQFGFTTTLLDLMNKEKPSHLAVVFEGGKSDTDTHRNAQYAEYKANRQEQPEDISNALPDIQRIVDGFSLPCLSSKGYEADDVIGTLALEAAELGYTVYMVTPDKDYGQLVRENVFIYKPGYQGGTFEILGPAEVCAKWNIKRVDQVVDILGLMGDAVDNIPGIAGVGEKTAAKLLAEYDTVEGVLAAADGIKGALGEKVRGGKENAIMSKQLARIVTDVPISFHEEDFRVKEINREKLEGIFGELEFKALSRRVLGEDASARQGVVALDLFGNPTGPQPAAVGADKDVWNGLREADTSGDGSKVEEFTTPATTIETTPHDYRLYTVADEIDVLIKELMAQSTIAFDTETTALDAHLAELVGISFSWEKGKGHYVAIPEGREQAIAVLERFRPLFERTDVTWVGQNLKYDLLMLKWYGFELAGPLWDTLLAHFLIEPDGKRNMDALSIKYLNYEPVSIEALIGKKGKGQLTMRDVPVEQVKEYAAEDADVTLQLQKVFEPMLDKGVRPMFTDIENPLIPILVDMEHAGVGVDVDFLQAYSRDLQRDIAIAEQSVYRDAGRNFNLGSPKQLGEVLFDILKIEGGGKKTKTGQYATGEEVLQKLRSKHPIVEDILTYRQLSKLKSTYVDALPLLVNSRTGRVHTCFNQTIAVTGRLSSINPNLQNIPIKSEAGREIRKAFVSKGEGWSLISADYSQIELRIIAALAGEENMIAAFADKKDIHTATAAGVFGVPESEVTSEQRRRAKAVNFGIIYGQTAFGLSESLGISRGEAKEVIDNYFRQYPFIKKYIESQVQSARARQYVESMMGRKRWLRDISSANQTVRGFAERNAVNMPIQGTAADMIKMAMIAVHRELKSAKMETRMILQVHDELIFDVPEGEVEKARKLIRDTMCGAMKLPNGVPIEAEAGVGKNWLEAH
jgi:DNA polymerase-1